jgi:hypothetical protein
MGDYKTSDCATLHQGEGGRDGAGDPACFSVLQNDSSRNVMAKGANRTRAVDDADEPTLDVERALAKALEFAAAAGHFEVVMQLLRELEARRRAPSHG